MDTEGSATSAWGDLLFPGEGEQESESSYERRRSCNGTGAKGDRKVDAN